jgi:oligopeptide/dipeptide ABC transporter ATP-binding protein
MTAAIEPLVEIEHLTKVFPVKTGSAVGRGKSHLSAVDDVSLTIGRGETLGLVGESGSGKTTLARLALRLIPLTSGAIRIGGVDVHQADRRALRELRRRVQIVFQDPYSSLDPRMSVGSIIAEGLQGLGRAERQRRIGELLERVGLARAFARRHPHQLSGGQRQRVGIARALAVDPQFLVLDEPVSALDVSVQSQVLNLLHDLQEDLGLTYLFISHDLTVVRHLAGRIAVMYLGKLVELAPADDIFERPRHPYTQALLSAMPSITAERRDRIILSGDIPSPIDPPEQCRFASRCFRQMETCWTTVPPLERVEPKHDVACFNPVPPPTDSAPTTSNPGGADGRS